MAYLTIIIGAFCCPAGWKLQKIAP